MRYLLLLVLLLAVDEGTGIDPHGVKYASDHDRGCAIDPNGCSAQTLRDEGGFIDPNG